MEILLYVLGPWVLAGIVFASVRAACRKRDDVPSELRRGQKPSE